MSTFPVIDNTMGQGMSCTPEKGVWISYIQSRLEREREEDSEMVIMICTPEKGAWISYIQSRLERERGGQ